MTCINENSVDGIKEILQKLGDRDAINLAKTVIQGLRKITSAEDAVQVIIKYSPDILSILRRKIVTREILFSYLDEKNIKIRLPTTKNELIDRVLVFWNLAPQNSSSDINSHSNQTTYQHLENTNGSEDVQLQNNSIKLLAEQFCIWFYTMLNGEGVGSEHFFADAKLTLNMFSNSDIDTTVVEDSPDQIAQTLSQVKQQHNLFFNPNVSNDGVQGRMDPHGLVMVLACGTLHIQDKCAGVYEQVFGLAKDPASEDNWKIKHCELNLRSKSGYFGQPKLCDSDLTSKLLVLPSD